MLQTIQHAHSDIQPVSTELELIRSYAEALPLKRAHPGVEARGTPREILRLMARTAYYNGRRRL